MGANAQTTVQKFVDGAVLTAAEQNFSAATGVPVFATTVTRDAAFGGANKVLAEGQTCYLESTNVVQYYDGAAWVAVAGFAQTMAIFNETQASGTAGGVATAGAWVKRTLNTTNLNDIVGASIAASVITLPAGSYFVQLYSPTRYTQGSKNRLRNTTDSTTPLLGISGYEAAGDSSIMLLAVGAFTIASAKSFELQQYATAALNANDLGVPTSIAGISEVYSTAQITKTA